MVAGLDLAMLDLRRIDIPEAERAVVIAPLHLEHLVEIAIEDFTLPADVDGVATHQALRGRGV